MAPADLPRARGVNVGTGRSLCSGSVFTKWTNQAPGLLPPTCIWKCEPGEPARKVKGSDWKESSRMEPSAVVPQAHRYG